MLPRGSSAALTSRRVCTAALAAMLVLGLAACSKSGGDGTGGVAAVSGPTAADQHPATLAVNASGAIDPTKAGDTAAPDDAANSAVATGTGPEIPPAQVNYDWDGRTVSGPSTRLPDGKYHCYLSNAPAASFTYWGEFDVAGSNVKFNGAPGTITYTSTTNVVIKGAGLDPQPRAVVFRQADNGHPVLWLRFKGHDSRCA